MRIAILSHQAPPGDAIGNSVADKASFFHDRGAQVGVFLEVTKPAHPRLRSFIHAIGQETQTHDSIRFMADADLVLVEYGQYYPALSLLPLLAGRKPRILLDYHGVTPPELWSHHNRESLLLGWQQRGIAWCADRVMVHSKFAARELKEACRFPEARTVIIPHPVSGALVAEASIPAKAACDLRTELGLQNSNIVLFVGRLAPNKRLGVLIKALARLREQAPSTHLLVVGNTEDVYRVELNHCLELARSLSVSERVHILGQVSEQRLRECYAAADLFVMPSVHEGFCIPVLEAMARGAPVIAAHAGALPETVGDAGFLFTPDDDAELARRIERLLKEFPARDSGPKCQQGEPRLSQSRADQPGQRAPRVAIVCFRFGAEIVGGAEKSLARMAWALLDAGVGVEVFATCTQQESGWSNELPAGTRNENGLLTHRFAIDPFDRQRHNAIVRRVLEQDGQVDPAGELEFVRHSIHSTSLVECLKARIGEFDAIVTGPYLAGLTYEICLAFPEKTLLVPCLHDEAAARLQIWRRAYRAVGGILYHSATEKSFAEENLGLNHPRSTVIGTWLNTSSRGDAQRGQALAGSPAYVVYCGRYSPQKNVPLLLDWFRQFQERHPGKLSLVFIGQGSVSIPQSSWCRNFGFVDDQTRADLLAGARALVHLSVNESLSLVALEAWAGGTPVIAHQKCAVLDELVDLSGGGVTVDDHASFERALLDLLARPAHWQALGENGKAYVAQHFVSKGRYTDQLLEAIFSLSLPLGEIMKVRGRKRAADHTQEAWRARFGRAIEEVLDAPAQVVQEHWRLIPHRPAILATVGQETAFVPARLCNLGTHAALSEGPGARVLMATTLDGSLSASEPQSTSTALPCVIVPEQQVSVVVRARVPAAPGTYRVAIRCQPPTEHIMKEPPDAVVDLIVSAVDAPVGGSCGPLLQAAGAALAEADRRQALPDDYLDVTQGRLAGVKRRIKQKLLSNFKHAYVDVLSRRQTAFNKALLEAVQEALECCALLDHAISSSVVCKSGSSSDELTQAVERAIADGESSAIVDVIRELVDEVIASRDRQDALERRLAALEQAVRPAELSPALGGSSDQI
jgi:glycosyltransferase involved in cell wall biosynthesis